MLALTCGGGAPRGREPREPHASDTCQAEESSRPLRVRWRRSGILSSTANESGRTTLDGHSTLGIRRRRRLRARLLGQRDARGGINERRCERADRNAPLVGTACSERRRDHERGDLSRARRSCRRFDALQLRDSSPSSRARRRPWPTARAEARLPHSAGPRAVAGDRRRWAAARTPIEAMRRRTRPVGLTLRAFRRQARAGGSASIGPNERRSRVISARRRKVGACRTARTERSWSRPVCTSVAKACPATMCRMPASVRTR